MRAQVYVGAHAAACAACWTRHPEPPPAHLGSTPGAGAAPTALCAGLFLTPTAAAALHRLTPPHTHSFRRATALRSAGLVFNAARAQRADPVSQYGRLRRSRDIVAHGYREAELGAFQHHRLDISEFLVGLLAHSAFTDHPAVDHLLSHTDDILGAFLTHQQSSRSVLTWANSLTKQKYAEAIRNLTDKRNGWHFVATRAAMGKLEVFEIEDMAREMKEISPELWELLGLLLSADRRARNVTLDDPMDINDDDLPDSKSMAEKLAERYEALLVIKRVVIISVLMQSTNRQANMLQSVIGIFLHASNTPSKVIETLARMGVSISADSIHGAVHSLSRETSDRLRSMGQTLLVSYAYDNFDINFPNVVPTIEKSTDTLTHMTSGGLIYMEHGVEPDDLRCSKELWKTNPLNPEFDASKAPPAHTVKDLEDLHPEQDHASGLTRRERFNAWKFLLDLVTYGPPYFHQFLSALGLPEMVEQIATVLMRWAPAKSLDIKQSTVAGNIEVVPKLLEQGAVGDPSQADNSIWLNSLLSIVAYVVLFHGDLGTGERLMSIMQRRSIEHSPWQRYQYVIYVMGLFHLKMACADAIWRIFIEPKTGREDPNSLMHFVALHRPKETGKIGSDPGFRRMHEVIMHTGAALRLDAWRVEVTRRNPAWKTLEDFAASKPKYKDLVEISEYLASHYVAGAEDLNIYELRCKPSSVRDQQQENILQMHQYFLLYEEMSFSMNYGDIGRVETLFPPWIYIFKAVGKHKYATHMVKFMTDVHFVYPARLRHAIRYNMLPNPKGEEGKCRGVDWVVEQMINLPTKDTYGGRGSNYTKKRVLEESPLIQVYSQCCGNIERNFQLTSLTSRQAAPDMTKTLRKMAIYTQEHGPNEIRAGRKTTHSIPDIITQGIGKMVIPEQDQGEDGEDEDENDTSNLRGNIEPEDLLVDT
ncbi:hypothetical protein GGX14DRAFT_573043 [Mycena pura]|uniref:DUF6589 domain-containing protein n=1 Tax=Mycena pura TaxID=153505 RepID=A0AAD6UZP8_9AGAR|nr:hypothetical protein GGX14DRAFT_573043 [Mycena pura]